MEKYLHKLKHSSPLHNQNIPQKWRIPQYGTIIQYEPDDDTTSELDKDKKKPIILLESCCTMIGM